MVMDCRKVPPKPGTQAAQAAQILANRIATIKQSNNLSNISSGTQEQPIVVGRKKLGMTKTKRPRETITISSDDDESLSSAKSEKPHTNDTVSLIDDDDD